MGSEIGPFDATEAQYANVHGVLHEHGEDTGMV